MPASHKFKLTLLDTKVQKLTAGQLKDGSEKTSYSNLIGNSSVHSLVWVAYLTIYGVEASEQVK